MTTPSTVTPESVSIQGVRKGRFVWYDLVTNDVETAIAFYSKIAGWGTEEFEMRPKEQYRIWTVTGAQIGDVVKLGPEHGPPGTQPYWMSHVEVPDVDATARETTALGGRVITPPPTYRDWSLCDHR
jgi:predicted enzyme related to lactoylglutathione lyase